jgi:hypothetical protein
VIFKCYVYRDFARALDGIDEDREDELRRKEREDENEKSKVKGNDCIETEELMQKGSDNGNYKNMFAEFMKQSMQQESQEEQKEEKIDTRMEKEEENAEDLYK